MSVMLKTTNPAAIAEIDAQRDRRVPYEGQWLIFHMRPGEGRAGKLRAPAVVTRVEDEEHVELIIYFAADDAINRWKIPRKSDQNPVNAWSFTDWDEKNYRPVTEDAEAPKPEGHLTWDDVKVMHDEIGKLRAEIAELQDKATAPRKPGSQVKS